MRYCPSSPSYDTCTCGGLQKALALCRLGSEGSILLVRHLSPGVRFVLQRRFGPIPEAEVLEVAQAIAMQLLANEPQSARELEQRVSGALSQQVLRLKARSFSEGPRDLSLSQVLVDQVRLRKDALGPKGMDALRRDIRTSNSGSLAQARPDALSARIRKLLQSLRGPLSQGHRLPRKAPAIESVHHSTAPALPGAVNQ